MNELIKRQEPFTIYHLYDIEALLDLKKPVFNKEV